MLKVEISAGDKNKTLDFEPAFGETGVCEAVFIPTYAGNNDICKQAIAQPTTQNPFLNNTEIAAELSKVLSDVNTHYIKWYEHF